MIVCFVVAVISFTTDFSSKSLRFFGIVWILLGVSCIYGSINEIILPNFGLYIDFRFHQLLINFGILCSSFANNFAPYFYLLFCLDRLKDGRKCYRHKKTFAFFMLILPMASFIIVFQRSLEYYLDNVNFIIISLWSIPYVLFGSVLLVYSYKKAVSQQQIREALLVCYLSIPTAIIGVVNSFLLRAFGLHNSWMVNRWLAVAVFILYVYLISHFGFLGVKLRIERMTLENTIRAVMTSTSILNHTIKNEVIKIIISTNNIKDAKDPGLTCFDDHFNVILNSAHHLEAMAKKIQENTKEIFLDKKTNKLSEIIESSISLIKPFLDKKKISIIVDYDHSIILMCDKIHLQEVIVNLLQNAIEAIEYEGKIEICCENSKKSTLLYIKDSGQGIPKELIPFIFEPFFSTKAKNVNYGFGLSYCHNIMQKHGGTIDIESEPNKGTIVCLTLPKVGNKKR